MGYAELPLDILGAIVVVVAPSEILEVWTDFLPDLSLGNCSNGIMI